MANPGMPNNQPPLLPNGLAPSMPIYPVQQPYFYPQSVSPFPPMPPMPYQSQMQVNGHYVMDPLLSFPAKSPKKPNLPVFKPPSSKNAPVVEKKELPRREKKIILIIDPKTKEVINKPTEKSATESVKDEIAKKEASGPAKNETAKKEATELVKDETTKKVDVQKRGQFQPPPRTKTEEEDKEGYAARGRFESDFMKKVKMDEDDKVVQPPSSLPNSEESKSDVKKIGEVDKGVQQSLSSSEESKRDVKESGKKSDGVVKKSDGAAKKPEGVVKKPDGAAKKPEGSAKKTDGAAKKPEESVKAKVTQQSGCGYFDSEKSDGATKKSDEISKAKVTQQSGFISSDTKKPDETPKSKVTQQSSGLTSSDEPKHDAVLDEKKPDYDKPKEEEWTTVGSKHKAKADSGKKNNHKMSNTPRK